MESQTKFKTAIGMEVQKMLEDIFDKTIHTIAWLVGAASEIAYTIAAILFGVMVLTHIASLMLGINVPLWVVNGYVRVVMTWIIAVGVHKIVLPLTTKENK